MLSAINAINQHITDRYALYHGDACELIRAIPDNSVHFGVHSPPFEGLYKFSNSDRDISNGEGAVFWEHYGFLIGELLRITLPGRLHSVHVMQLPATKTRDGFIGMRDFRGDVMRTFQAAGWLLHSEVCIWKDPVVAQQRTKSIRLLHKQLCKDSALSGQGLADYIVTFRKPGDNAEPIDGMLDCWIGDDSARLDGGAGAPGAVDVSRAAYDAHAARVLAEGRSVWPFETWRSILVWQRYASPVWSDIRATRTLQYRGGRDEKDEQHISPLQLDVIERCIDLWSNPGDTVLTPFAGIGSEVWCAANMGRRGIGFELKESYYRQALKNLAELDADLEGMLA